MLKEIVIAIQAYRKAHIFIGKHRLWKWILIPGLAYMILFTIGLYFFWISADTAVSHLSQFTGVDRWLHHQHSAAWSFILIMVGIMVRLIMMFFYFSLFKYLFLILGSPVFSYLSEKTESIIEGKEFVFNSSVFFHDITTWNQTRIPKLFLANRIYYFYSFAFLNSAGRIDCARNFRAWLNVIFMVFPCWITVVNGINYPLQTVSILSASAGGWPLVTDWYFT